MQTDDNTAPLSKRTRSLRKALKMLSPGTVYTLAPRTEIMHAMTLLRNNPVRNLYWEVDHSKLYLEVADRGISECSISVVDGQLSTSCDCRTDTTCRHIVAALAIVKKIFSPESFKNIRADKKHMAMLSGLFFAGTPTGRRKYTFRLLVQRGESDLSIFLANGTVSASTLDPGLTKRQTQFIELLKVPSNADNIIQLYADTVGSDAPIVFLHGEVEVPLHYFPDSVRTTKTLLDVTDGMVSIQKVFEDAQHIAAESFASNHYHFDIPAGRIEPIDSAVGWNFWNDVSQAATLLEKPIPPTNTRVTLSVEDFNKLGMVFSGDNVAPSLVLSVNGVQTDAEERALIGNIHIRISEGGDLFSLLCGIDANGTLLSLSSVPFGMLTEHEKWRFAAGLRTKKRFSHVVLACFALLHCTTTKEQNATLKSAFSSDEFLKDLIVSEAKKFAISFAEGCHGNVSVLLTDGSIWGKYGMDIRDQARLLEIPFTMFGAMAFTGTSLPGELLVSRSELMPHLQELQKIIESAGFRMLFNGKTVRRVKWDISLDATHSSIDWFELRPEVKCEGGEVSLSELEEAVKGGGMYMKHGEFVMLDDETNSILKIFPKPEKSHGERSGPVRIPRLQILDWLHLRKNGITVRLSPEDEKIFASITSFAELPVTPMPEGICATLRHYQIDGYNWLAFLYEHRFGACLADDMGLGKTLQAITLLAGLHEGKIISHASGRLPHLIVVPPTLLFNWESEMARFCPTLRVTAYRGIDRSTDFSGFDVVLASYGIVQRDVEVLAELHFDVIIYDEAQAVKNIQNGTTGACRRLKGIFSLTLTGTPVENHLGEYYSVMDISVPGLLGEYSVFRRNMNNTGPFIDMLIRRTRPFIMRRTKAMISSELPPKIETDIYLELTDKQKTLYTKTVAEVKVTVNEAYSGKAAGQARIIALTAILRLRQLCLSPEILYPANTEPSPKIDFLIEQIEELFDEGHSVLVFSQFTRFLDIAEKRLASTELPYLRLDGNTPMGTRKKLVNEFQKSKMPTVFLLSLKAGGKGLNLTRATYVFHLDPWWNPAVEDQASDRAHRIGQTAQVTITRLIMRHTIEEKMMELKKRKLALYKALLDDASSGGKTGISREDFNYLLT